MRGNRPNKIIGIAKNLDFKKILVLKDKHIYDDNSINSILRNIISEIEKKSLIDIILIQYAIESWFLSDINAINQVFNVRINKNISNPESIQNPDKELNNILEKFGKKYIKSYEIGKKIMETANFNEIANKCKSFEKFLIKLKNLT